MNENDPLAPFGPAIVPIRGGRRFAPVSGLNDVYDFWGSIAEALASRLPETAHGLMAEGEPIIPSAARAIGNEVGTIREHLRGSMLDQESDPVDDMVKRSMYNRFMTHRYGKENPNDVYLPEGVE